MLDHPTDRAHTRTHALRTRTHAAHCLCAFAHTLHRTYTRTLRTHCTRGAAPFAHTTYHTHFFAHFVHSRHIADSTRVEQRLHTTAATTAWTLPGSYTGSRLRVLRGSTSCSTQRVVPTAVAAFRFFSRLVAAGYMTAARRWTFSRCWTCGRGLLRFTFVGCCLVAAYLHLVHPPHCALPLRATHVNYAFVSVIGLPPTAIRLRTLFPVVAHRFLFQFCAPAPTSFPDGWFCRFVHRLRQRDLPPTQRAHDYTPPVRGWITTISPVTYSSLPASAMRFFFFALPRFAFTPRLFCAGSRPPFCALLFAVYRVPRVCGFAFWTGFCGSGSRFTCRAPLLAFTYAPHAPAYTHAPFCLLLLPAPHCACVLALPCSP